MIVVGAAGTVARTQSLKKARKGGKVKASPQWKNNVSTSERGRGGGQSPRKAWKNNENRGVKKGKNAGKKKKPGKTRIKGQRACTV